MDWLIKVGIWVLEFLFFAGLIGSALVILLSGLEDIETILEKEEATPSQPDISGA